MRIKTLLVSGFAAAAVTAAISGCSSQSDSSSTPTTATPAMSSSAMAPSGMNATGMGMTGTFAGLNGKTVSGKATVAGHTITLADFSSDQGPDLHLYLADGTSEANVTSGVELGKVAYDMGAQTFTVPANVDVGKYTDVVVHCDKAKAVFGAAPLSK